jgi:hypothetical protein
VTDLLVDDDGVVVVEGEGRRKTVQVDGEADDDERRSHPADARFAIGDW